MGDWHGPQGPFDIPDVPNYVPRRLKPWLFIFFVLIVQFSGGIYLAAATDMVGSTALMQEDILMAGYASLVGMSINFAVMFRLKIPILQPDWAAYMRSGAYCREFHLRQYDKCSPAGRHLLCRGLVPYVGYICMQFNNPALAHTGA